MKKVFLRLLTLLTLGFICPKANAQCVEPLKSQLLAHFFQKEGNGTQPKRHFIKSGHGSKVTQIAAGSLIYFYQNFVSEQIQAQCTYEITCSEYIKLCITRYGFFKGSFAGLNQYMKCSPANSVNHESHRINDDGKIINNPNDEL